MGLANASGSTTDGTPDRAPWVPPAPSPGRGITGAFPRPGWGIARRFRLGSRKGQLAPEREARIQIYLTELWHDPDMDHSVPAEQGPA